MMKRRYLAVVFSCLVLGAAIFLAFYGSKPVKVGYLPIAAHLPLFVALDRNKNDTSLFAKRDVDVEAIPFNNSSTMMDALINGKIDVAYELGSDEVIRVNMERPGAFKVYQVGYSTAKEPIDSILVTAASQKQSLVELKGGSIGVFPGPTAGAMARLLLEEAGLKVPDDVDVKVLIPGTELSALRAGEVEAVFAYEPLPTVASKSGDAKELLVGPVENQLNLDPWIGGMGIMSIQFLRDHPKEAAAFRDAIYDAFDLVEQYPSEARAVLRKGDYVRGLENQSDSVLRTIRLTRHWRMKEIDIVAVNRTVDFYRHNNIIPSTQPLSLVELIAAPSDFLE